jgi:hypothetical protein
MGRGEVGPKENTVLLNHQQHSIAAMPNTDFERQGSRLSAHGTRRIELVPGFQTGFMKAMNTRIAPQAGAG